MSLVEASQSVGELVRAKPDRARVFEQLRIDYCCGGKLPLVQACEKRGMDVQQVLAQIIANDQSESELTEVNADAMTLAELADHIEATHHAYLRRELPRLDALTEKVARVHCDKEPRLVKVRAAFVALKDELEPHMLKEERVLFPWVRSLAEKAVARPCGGSVGNPIRQMEHEHEHAGEALAIMRENTDGYTPPAWACNTYRAMLDALARLEADMHRHVHKENNVLFPKALQAEQACEKKGSDDVN